MRQSNIKLNYLDNPDQRGVVWHEMMGKGRRATKVPHEWYFIKLLIHEILKDNTLAEKFITYIIQYHWDYPWICFDANDYFGTALINLDISNYKFEKKYIFKFDDINEENFNMAMITGEYATDFLIRYKGYSLVKCQGQNIIITAHSDCHKRFEELLSKGYSLHRKAKIGWVNLSYGEYLKGLFYKLPVFPTKDIGYPIDEIIESSEADDVYRRVLTPQNKRNN